jgi:hypothetical protein
VHRAAAVVPAGGSGREDMMSTQGYLADRHQPNGDECQGQRAGSKKPGWGV